MRLVIFSFNTYILLTLTSNSLFLALSLRTGISSLMSNSVTHPLYSTLCSSFSSLRLCCGLSLYVQFDIFLLKYIKLNKILHLQHTMHLIERYKKEVCANYDYPPTPTQSNQFQYFCSLPRHTNHCVVCNKPSPYTCPQCKKPFCNASHYRSHNLYCSEHFFQKQVETALKGIKVRDPAIKKQAIRLAHQHRRILAEDSHLLLQSINDIPQSRLQQLTTLLQANQQPTLTQQQNTLFQQYVQNNAFPPWTPFWEVQQGLCYYYLQNQPQIEDYLHSAHTDLLNERMVFGKVLQQDTPKIQDVVDPSRLAKSLNITLLNIVRRVCILFRLHNGQLSREQVLNIQDDPNAQEVVWMELANEDCLRVFQSKYLVVEVMMRMLEILRGTKDNADHRGIDQTFQQGGKKLTSKEKKEKNKLIRVSKKIQLLLSYSNDVLFQEEHVKQVGEDSVLRCNNIAMIREEIQKRIEDGKLVKEIKAVRKEVKSYDI